MITSGSRNEPKNKQQAARRSQSSYLIRGSCGRVGRKALLQQARRGAVGGVMRPGMQLSFLFDCDDVALPALKLDPDAEMAVWSLRT